MDATVTIEYVNPPKPGKKMGSIKTKEQGYIGVWPNDLSNFEKGGVYNIEFEQQGDFKKFKAVKTRPQPTSSGRGNGEPPPILSNVLAHAVQAGLCKSPENLCDWAKWTKEAIRTFNAPASSGQEPPLPDSSYGDGPDPEDPNEAPF